MNKKKAISLAIIITIVLVLLVIYKSVHGLRYIIIKNGYDSYESKIIANYQEYLEFVDYVGFDNKAYGKVYKFNPNKYNEKYFNKKSLAILNIVTGTGMNKLKSINISVSGDTLICNAYIDYTKSQIVTDDINGKLILVEIDKSIKNFIINK